MGDALQKQSGARPVILIVDDEPAIAGLCATVLQQAGFDVLKAGSSPEALKICSEDPGRIDALLTDLVLPPPEFQLASAANPYPHVHGMELAARAAAVRTGLKIGLMSGNPDQELASHGIRRGTLPFLKKPFATQELVSFVGGVLAAPPPALKMTEEGAAAHDVEWFD